MNVFKTVVNRFLVVLIAGFLMGGAAPHAWAKAKIDNFRLDALSLIDDLITVYVSLIPPAENNSTASSLTSTSSAGAWTVGVAITSLAVYSKSKGTYVNISWQQEHLVLEELGRLTATDMLSPHYVPAKRRFKISRAEIISATGDPSGTAAFKIGMEAGIGRELPISDTLTQQIEQILTIKGSNHNAGFFYATAINN